MSEIKMIAKQYYSRMDELKGQISKMSDLFTDDFVVIFPGAPGPLSASEFELMAAGIYAAFGDLHHDVFEQIQDGNKVASVVEMTGVHVGEFNGIPATNRPIKFGGITTHEVRDGKIVNHRVSADLLGLVGQIS